MDDRRHMRLPERGPPVRRAMGRVLQSQRRLRQRGFVLRDQRVSVGQLRVEDSNNNGGQLVYAEQQHCRAPLHLWGAKRTWVLPLPRTYRHKIVSTDLSAHQPDCSPQSPHLPSSKFQPFSRHNVLSYGYGYH